MDYGKLELHQAHELTVLKHLQRDPAPATLRKLKNWDDAKVGLLLVARITTGRHKGRLHVYDGGARLAHMLKNNPNYVFACWVRDMTEEEAADNFLSFHDSQKPNAFDNYKVSVRAGDESALAVKKALDRVGLQADPHRSQYPQNGSKGYFNAFAAARTIVRDAHKQSDDWEHAAQILALSLELYADAYPLESRYTANMTRAIARIILQNPRLHEDDELWMRLAHTIGARDIGEWDVMVFETKKNMPGSAHRGTVLAGLVKAHHNAGRPPKRLTLE